MRETAFRGLLARRLGARSVDSYIAYARRVERDLNVDLDACDLSEPGVRALGSRLRAAGIPDNSIRNALSALRAYAELDSIRPAATPDPTPPQTSALATMRITREQRQTWQAGAASSPFNRWLDGQVRSPDGGLDLERLHAVALEYGVDRREPYRDLNPGQQRMNLGNILRRVVPPTVYAARADVPPAPAAEPPEKRVSSWASSPNAPAALLPRRPLVSESATGDLLSLYGEIMDELRARGVVRTGNSPVGDYAELLFANAFGWSLEPNSASGHDATDAAGVRYQIKARRLSRPTASRQLSAIRRLPDRTFDHLAAVLFDPSFKVTRAAIIPHEVIVSRARWVEHTHSWTFMLDDRVWKDTGVRDVTAELAVAASKL